MVDTLRTAPGFRAIEGTPTSTSNVARIGLWSDYENNNKWYFNEDCEMVIIATAGCAKLEMIPCSTKSSDMLYSKANSMWVGAIGTLVIGEPLVDMITIPKGTPYRWKMRSDLSIRPQIDLFVISTPPWRPEQYKPWVHPDAEKPFPALT